MPLACVYIGVCAYVATDIYAHPFLLVFCYIGLRFNALRGMRYFYCICFLRRLYLF
ncbi:hypothetical protein CAMRE0001_0421 [Campylobacter rectus RM3267]|uniref:Uncharacterized protein n=1 Tax=Campylobacter rectus RM3267 TaxID=553218 RepID=B9D2I8_CAMRE|nr:hypothetical protein CAMRE0001_0421 [Campylobacter rectus RM3267]